MDIIGFLGKGKGALMLLGACAALLAVLFLLLRTTKFAPRRGRILIVAALLELCGVFFLLTFGLEDIEAVGSSAKTAPRLWASLLAFFSLDWLRRVLSGDVKPDPESGDLSRVFRAVAVVALAIWGMEYVGFYIATGGMILLLLLLLGERRPLLLLSLPGGWALFSYYVFARVLLMDLPTGALFG